MYNALGLTGSMCISDLMVSKSEFRYGDPGLFPGEVRLQTCFLILLRILMKKQWEGTERRVSMVKCRETPVEGERHVTTRETLYV